MSLEFEPTFESQRKLKTFLFTNFLISGVHKPRLYLQFRESKVQGIGGLVREYQASVNVPTPCCSSYFFPSMKRSTLPTVLCGACEREFLAEWDEQFKNGKDLRVASLMSNEWILRKDFTVNALESLIESESATPLEASLDAAEIHFSIIRFLDTSPSLHMRVKASDTL